MNDAYSSEPITFENIIYQRPDKEILENSTMLYFFFFDYSHRMTRIYLEQNDVTLTKDLILNGLNISLTSFFCDESLNEFREYVYDFREKKNDTEVINRLKNGDFKLGIIDKKNNIQSKRISSNSEFSNAFRNSKNILNNFKPKNHSEYIIFNAIKNNSYDEMIDKIVFNPALYVMK
jgi:hypothetical protein